MGSPQDDTYLDSQIRKLKNHPKIAVLLVIGICIAAIGQFTGALTSVVDFFEKTVHPGEDSATSGQVGEGKATNTTIQIFSTGTPGEAQRGSDLSGARAVQESRPNAVNQKNFNRDAPPKVQNSEAEPVAQLPSTLPEGGKFDGALDMNKYCQQELLLHFQEIEGEEFYCGEGPSRKSVKISQACLAWFGSEAYQGEPSSLSILCDTSRSSEPPCKKRESPCPGNRSFCCPTQ